MERMGMVDDGLSPARQRAKSGDPIPMAGRRIRGANRASQNEEVLQKLIRDSKNAWTDRMRVRFTTRLMGTHCKEEKRSSVCEVGRDISGTRAASYGRYVPHETVKPLSRFFSLCFHLVDECSSSSMVCR